LTVHSPGAWGVSSGAHAAVRAVARVSDGFAAALFHFLGHLLCSFASARIYYAVAACASAALRLTAGVKEAMRQKVAYSQQVLVRITLEDYGLIANNAEKLVELSNKTNWYSRQVPEYELFLNEFRRNAQELMEAGQQKNLDAASLAYVQMTLSCVSCHNFIRKSFDSGSH
jgi:uncharacterized membrane protein